MKKSYDEDAKERLSSSVDRKKRDDSTAEMSRESFLDLMKEFIRELVRSTAGRISRDQCTFEEFKRAIYKRTPAGSIGSKPAKELTQGYSKPMTLSKRAAIVVFGRIDVGMG